VLDWLVAKCEGIELIYRDEHLRIVPIIDRERITVHCFDGSWVAVIFQRSSFGLPVPCVPPKNGIFGQYQIVTKAFGINAQEAAMRCYVASKLGDTVEVPSELLQS
jgi:hypothetical protein